VSEASISKSSPPPRRSALRSGAFTGASTIVLAGSAAGAAALLGHKFGRNAATDGFMVAYGFYILLTIAAQAFRLVVVPDLTRAANEGRLGGEFRAYGFAFLALAVPVCVLVVVLAGPIGDLVTGSLPHRAAVTASDALVWLVPAAFLQLLGALCASALAARDSYAVAAVAYAGGGVLGLASFVALADAYGIVSLAWGLAANGALVFAVPFAALAIRGELRGPRAARWDIGRRLLHLLQGAAIPLALQAFYLVGLRLATQLGVGRVTSLSYAYLLVGTLSYAPAYSISIISSAPLTRRGLDERATVQHLLHAAWLSLVLVGGAAGIFALVGGKVISFVLGGAYAGEVGREIGRLVVELSPWMVGTVAFYVTFPLLFVLGRRKLLIPLAVGAIVLHALIGFALREAAGLLGICLALAISVLLVVAVMMAAMSPRILQLAAAGLGRLALVVVVLATGSFALSNLVLSPVPAAVLGTLVYVGLLWVAVRRLGLDEAWAYVRALS
jgi:hypothetical protein